ncbi:MAG: DNA adenine methylase [Pseudomonadota bacterium]
MNILKKSLDLFDQENSYAVDTEGIKYAGSKLKLLPHILMMTAQIQPRTVLDGFSGTTRVSQAFAQNGYNVVSSDISVWSEIFATCYLLGEERYKYNDLILHLNNVESYDGWFTEHYGGDSNSAEKRLWQYHNTRKLDGIRTEIDRLNLDKVEKAIALTSLILALDRVDNTIGHFTSYLKNWSSRSYNKLLLKVPKIIPSSNNLDHKILRSDIYNTAKSIVTDLAYLDPPYGSNNEKMPPSRVRYASYYHIWTTVILNDQPDLFGAANRRIDSRDKVAASVFEDFRKNEKGDFIAVTAIRKLLENVQAKNIILSYSSGGRATADSLLNVINAVGKIIAVKEINYTKNVMSGMRWTNDWIPDIETKNIEYLFLIKKS